MFNQIAIAMKEDHFRFLIKIAKEHNNEDLQHFLWDSLNDAPKCECPEYIYLYCKLTEGYQKEINKIKIFLRNLPYDEDGCTDQYDLLEVVNGEVHKEGNDMFLSVHYTIDFY